MSGDRRVRHLLDIDDLGGAERHRRGHAPHRLVRRGVRAAHPPGARAPGQDGGLALLRGLHPHPAVVRDGGQAALGRHHELLGQLVVGEEGRVAPRHRPRPSRPWASTPSSCATPRPARRTGSPSGSTPSVINAGDGWHEHPTQALLDCYTIRQHRGEPRGPAHRHRRRHQAQPGRPLRRPGVHRHGRRGHAGGPAHAAAAEPRGLAGEGQPRPRRGAAHASTSSTCCACSASA